MNEWETCIDEWATRCREKDATIAALQARVQELEDDRSAWKEIAQDWSAAAKLAEQPEKFYEGYSAAVMNAMQALLTKARAEFTQRTAERDALKQINDTHMKTVMKLSHVVEQRTAERDCARRRVDELEAREVDVVLLREDLEKRTAELEAAMREVDVWKEKAELRGKEACAQRAELERVSLLSSHNERRFEEVDKKYKELRTLIAALPKVEYEIKASNFIAHIWPDHDTEEPLVDLRASVAALLKHRQGMEG